MLILKIPKLVRILRKTKHRWYSKGWKECTKEKEEILSMLKVDKSKDLKIVTDELNESRISFKEKYEKLKKEYETEKAELKANHEKIITEIKRIAETEITKANEKEIEYETLLTKLRTLFHEGAVKFLITAEEQESLITDLAKVVHRKNQFLQLSQEFDKVLKDNNKTIDVTRLKQLGK